MRLILSILFIILYIPSVFSYDQVHMLNIDVPNSTTDLNTYTYVYSTLDTNSDLKSVLDKEFEYKPSGLNVGVNSEIHWIKYTINNQKEQNEKLYINFPYNHINKIIVYAVRDGKIIRKSRVGTYFSHFSKDFVCRNNVIEINSQEGLTEYYIYINHLYMPLRAVSFLLTETEMIKKIAEINAHIWFWKGIFVFALVLTLVLYILTKVKSFLYYFLLNLSTAMFFLMEIGDFVLLFDRDINGIIIEIKHLGNWLILIFSPLFVNSLYPIKKMRPKVWKTMFSLVLVIPFLWTLGLFPYFKDSMFFYYSTYYLILVSLVVFLLMIYFTLVAYRNGHKSAIFLFIAYLIYVTTAILNIILPNLGLKESTMDVYEVFIYGSLFEIFVFMALMTISTYEVYSQKIKLEKEQRKNKQDMLAAVVKGQEFERNRVGIELHDLVGANISAINLKVNSDDKELKSIISSTIAIVRNLSHGLVTPSIKGNRFCDEVVDLCLVFSNDKLKADASFFNWKGLKNPENMTHLYRIVQELLNNAVKHSQATSVNLQFVVNEHDVMSVFYEDNGIGFNLQKALKQGGIGLLNINNRIELIGADITYETNEGSEGTTVVIVIPNKLQTSSY